MKAGDRLANRVALITGGSGGIGAAIAWRLVEEGASVLLTDIAETRGQEIVKSIQAAGGRACFVRHDVSTERDWLSAFEHAMARFGGVHIVVNNAGTPPFGDYIEDTELVTWRRSIAVHLDGTFLGVKLGIQFIRNSGGGTIVNLSSIYGLHGFTRLADYSAAKGGVTLLTKCAALECAEKGYPIRVNSVHPGFVDTDMVKGSLSGRGATPESADFDLEGGLRSLAAAQVMKRLATPREVANTVLFLASDEASFINGAQIAVDGAYGAQ